MVCMVHGPTPVAIPQSTGLLFGPWCFGTISSVVQRALGVATVNILILRSGSDCYNECVGVLAGYSIVIELFLFGSLPDDLVPSHTIVPVLLSTI